MSKLEQDIWTAPPAELQSISSAARTRIRGLRIDFWSILMTYYVYICTAAGT
jgi:hypothetical protein